MLGKKNNRAKKSNYRPNVRPEIKKALYTEVGNKCANPGCSNTLLELHHIKEWHVYQTHDERDMIAVCPTCHGHVHRDRLRIDDPTIRSWKSIARSPSNRGLVYVEPGETCRVALGSIVVMHGRNTSQGLTIFRLSSRNQVSFRVAGRDILLLNIVITDTFGREIFRVSDGHVEHNAQDDVHCDHRTGRWRLTAPATAMYLPEWVLSSYNEHAPVSLVEDGMFTLLDIETLDRGLVQVQGLWAEDERAVVISRDWLSLYLSPADGFVHLAGERGQEARDLKSIIKFDGPIEYSALRALTRSRGL